MKEDGSFVQRLHEIFFSFNVGFAVIFPLLVFLDNSILIYSLRFLAPAAQVILRGAIQLNELLHLDPCGLTGREIIFTVLFLLISIFAFLFVRLIARAPVLRTVLSPMAGLFALALVPALWLSINEKYWVSLGGTLHWYVFAMEGSLICAVFLLVWKREIPLQGGLLILILIPILHYIWWLGIELPIICAFFFLLRKRKIPVWTGLLVLGLHYSWWLVSMWDVVYTSALWVPYVPMVFFVVFPGSGFAWYFHVRHLQSKSAASHLGQTIAPRPAPLESAG